ncbi:hypothetical protein [Pseudobacteroides cellulosolvens]|nr:hypothetical protein [Pseudobacteroides cellulosolvens]
MMYLLRHHGGSFPKDRPLPDQRIEFGRQPIKGQSHPPKNNHVEYEDHTMKKLRIILAIFVFLNILPLIGCWDMREINEIGLVTAVAVDKGTGNNKYSVTVQIANPTSENTSGSESKAKSTVWIGSKEGASLFDATRELVKISSRRIMWVTMML